MAGVKLPALPATQMSPLPVTLYTVSAVIILDSTDGKRVLAKYYDHALEFINSSKKQESFEKSIHEKTRKQNNQIALINEHVILYKNSLDLTICLVGRSEDSNELLLYTAVETIFETLSEIIKPQLDKKSVLEQYDLLALTVDEVIDKGVIIETEGKDLAQRLLVDHKKKSGSSSSDGVSSITGQLKEQTFSSAFNFAKQSLARAILKQ